MENVYVRPCVAASRKILFIYLMEDGRVFERFLRVNCYGVLVW